ncbi:MAG: hypothetical protein MAG451_01605 [Anaerolineales bacterium]|nr:hypothetical protein [Anaerolineales bacterium]
MAENAHNPDKLAALRQRAEEVLQRQPEELREIPPDNIQDLIHELRVHQTELEMQNEELRRTQWELELARDRYLDLYDLSEDQDIYYLHRRQLFETQEPQVCEMRMVGKDGSQFWVRIEAVAAQDNEGQAVCRATMSDVTERKQVEEELERHREHLEEMVEERTADMRTVINAMAGREARMAGLKKAIKKLRAQLEETGLEPVADDPLFGDSGGGRFV